MSVVDLEIITPEWPAPPGVRAAFTLRMGGVSAAPYDSLNLGARIGDSPEAVAENRRRVRDKLGLPAEPVWLEQVHGVEVVELGALGAVETLPGGHGMARWESAARDTSAGRREAIPTAEIGVGGTAERPSSLGAVEEIGARGRCAGTSIAREVATTGRGGAAPVAADVAATGWSGDAGDVGAAVRAGDAGGHAGGAGVRAGGAAGLGAAGDAAVGRGDSRDRTPTGDASVAHGAGQVCAIRVADCMPVLFAARDGSVVGAAHAGWRGLAGGVLEATIGRLGVAGGELIAWMGPAIGPKHFEVGEDVRSAFTASDAGAASAFVANDRGRWQCDLYALARRRLSALGVRGIYGGGWCTFAEASRFFSYRRDGQSGRMAALIWIDRASG
jgi:YfiH family protein